MPPGRDDRAALLVFRSVDLKLRWGRCCWLEFASPTLHSSARPTMGIHGMHKYIYYARQFFSFTVLVLSVVVVFMCRHTGFFQWTSPKQSESEAADAAIYSVTAGIYALCVKTGHDFCYPITVFLLVDIMLSLCLLLSLVLFAVTVCLGQRSLESRLPKYFVLA